VLAEALVYARARLAGQANPYGHLTEQVGIWARHRRRGRAWAGHLARAKGLCLAAADALAPGSRRTALVLGAGLLLDVPLTELSLRFRRVVLADMSFLPSACAKARALGNVECRAADLSGCMDRLATCAARTPPQPAPTPDLALGLPDLDFVYSANLLSQIPLFAMSALRRHAPQLSEDALERFAGSLVTAHVNALRALPAACLVTDSMERGKKLGKGRGAAEYEADLLFGAGEILLSAAALAPGCERWTWDMAPDGEAEPGLDVEREVIGVPNVSALFNSASDRGEA
jgi:hypothetical protein